MRFSFTISNSILGVQTINEPDGWRDIKIKLERDKNFHCLVEMIDTSFFYYNVNNFIDGGRQFIYTVEQTQGIAAKIVLFIYCTQDDEILPLTPLTLIFQGNLDLSTIVDKSKGDKFYNFKCQVIPSDLWSMFLNRLDTKIDLGATTDIDGAASSAVNIQSIAALGQKIDKKYYAQNFAQSEGSYYDLEYDFDVTNRYANIDLPKIDFNEFKTKFNYSNLTQADDPLEFGELFSVEETGTYTFDCQIVLSSNPHASGGIVPAVGQINVYVETSNNAPIAFSQTNVGTPAVDQRSVYTYTGSVFLRKGASIVFYINDITVGGGTRYIISNDVYEFSWIQIIATTEFYLTNFDSVLIHDAADNIVKKITGGFDVYSDYIGGITSGYGANGCGSLYVILLGLHMRGYSMTEKQFSMSFNEWWTGANPILNLYLGVETISSVDYIRIEDKAHAYNNTPILYFSNVENIERSYDQSMILKSLEAGYSTWSAEVSSGIDDPQSQRTYSSIFKTIGTELKLLSSWVAASLAIEETRRITKKGDDWKLDNNIIVIATQYPVTAPEFGNPFGLFTNLNNEVYRWNVRLGVVRNVKRWIRYLSCSLWNYTSTPLKFNSGEGNYKMGVASNSDTCDTGTWTEDQDITPVSNPYFTAEMYTFETDLSFDDYQLLKANRTQAIAVSQTSSDHRICHIDTLEYAISRGRVSIKAWVTPP